MIIYLLIFKFSSNR